jgi:hypothetical protein
MRSGYTDHALERWAVRIAIVPLLYRRARDVYCYFDNEIRVCAPFDADRLRTKLGIARAHESFVFPARSALTEPRPATSLPRSRSRYRRAPPGGADP